MAAVKRNQRRVNARFERRLRAQRKRAFWDWTLDLGQVRTKADFVALVKEHFRERVRAGFIKEFRIQAGARFWSSFNWELAGYFGNIRLRILGWAQFERRQRDYARKLQTHFRQLRAERGAAGFQVEFDRPSQSPVRFRTFIRYFYLGPKCKLTVPALVAALRGHSRAKAGTVLLTRWPEVEFDFGLEGVRRLTNKAGVDLDFGGYRLHLLLNDTAGQVARLRRYQVDNFPEHDERVLATCKSVLEVWSWDDDPQGRFSSQRSAVFQCIQERFGDLYLEEDDPLTE